MEPKETQLTTGIKDMSLTLNKPYIAYVFKKTQKISQALYLLTDYFNEAEPLRFSIRNNANILLTSATLLLKNEQKDKHISSHHLIATFLETLTLIETAFIIHLLSEKNHLILKEEINKVLDTMETHKEKGLQLAREFIEVGSLEDHKRQSVVYKGQEPVLNIKDSPLPSKSEKLVKAVQQENKNRRLDSILSLFKPGIELMIKDITSHFKDVSEKTIQRELLLLVDQGKLKKIGKKRWSKYRLN